MWSPACEVFEQTTEGERKMTNGDKIRAMSNEELAMLFIDKDNDETTNACRICVHSGNVCMVGTKCEDGIKQWLESEAKSNQ